MARAVEPHKDAVEGTGTAMGTAWPPCRLVCPQPFPLGLSTRSPLGTSRATEEGEGEGEEDARRTFEAGPERPLGVIDDGLPRRDLRMLRGLRWLLAARWRHGASVLLVELRQMARGQQVTRLLASGLGLATACRHASREALAGSCIRPLREAAAPRSSGHSSGRSSGVAVAAIPARETEEALRGRASRRPTWRQATVAM